MKYLTFLSLISMVIALVEVNAQQVSIKPSRWKIEGNHQIKWSAINKSTLPHKDNIEMAGKRVAAIITYAVDTSGLLSLDRHVFFPQLQPFIKETDPGWFIYRAYLKQHFGDDILPRLIVNEKIFEPGKLKSMQIDGELEFSHAPSVSGLSLNRRLYPSMQERLFLENWTIKNESKVSVEVKTGNTNLSFVDFGQKGKFERLVTSDAPEKFALQPGETISFNILIMAKLGSEEFPASKSQEASVLRQEFLDKMTNSLVLETPDSVLNTLFAFSKIRAAESIFESKLGLIHSPGGGRYYLGIWANDQAEYVSPFFPYLGYETGNISAINTYKAFAGEMNPDYKAMRYAFEIEGNVPPFKLDRGDAAMIAYGASQFALAYGQPEYAKELWPLIEWCLAYCHKKRNAAGVVMSESDEMEGRIETGDANLSTSSLYYGALNHSKDLGKAIGIGKKQINNYAKRAVQLKNAIEGYFGSTVEGLDTYKYYQEHRRLRHWICLPLVVGIHERKQATIEALFERLWTKNGVHVEKSTDNPKIAEIFWDRGTLYALRGTFIAGETELSLKKLKEFSRARLLGNRVPYVVEAYPEGNMAHLSAESALYCRVLIEGMFGIKPTGLSQFECTPRLPNDWEGMTLKNINAFQQNFNLMVKRSGSNLRVVVYDNIKNAPVLDQSFTPGASITVKF